MSKKRALLNAGSIALLTVPNALYLGFNFDILKEANAVALTMSAMLILAVVGLGALAHFKANGGVWMTLIGIFILSLSNISWVAGIALCIEGGGLAIDGYVFTPLIQKVRMEELKSNGEQITYTKQL